MNREQAKNLIIETFENPFDKGNFDDFINNLLKNFDSSVNSAPPRTPVPKNLEHLFR